VLEVGAQADLCAIDPQALASYNPEERVEYIFRDLFEHHQMVNRPQGVVTHTMIAGHMAWENDAFTPTFETLRMGRVLRHKDHPAEQAFCNEKSAIAMPTQQAA
jgi:N-acyl-D-aspartate/D-glutamate deacylase